MVNTIATITSDSKVIFFKKSFVQRFVDYLGPTHFNPMPGYYKIKVICKYSDAKMSVIEFSFMSLF